MVKRANELEVLKKTGLFDGKGEVSNVLFMSQEEAMGHGRLFAKTIIPPGNSIGVHTHKADMEMYYILEGTAKMTDDGEEAILKPGDVQICPVGHSHSIENIGDTDLSYVAIILFDNK